MTPPMSVWDGGLVAALMGAISDAILAVDMAEAPLFYNSRFALNFAQDMTRRRRRLDELFQDADILEAFRSVLREGCSSPVKVVRADTDAGKRYFSVSVSPLRDESGELYGAVGLMHDVTDLKAAEQIRIDFVANVSHELRTPLTSIQGYAHTLMDDVRAGRPAEMEFLETIVRNAARLTRLIDDLLDLSALEGGDGASRRAVDTRELTDRVALQLRGALAAKGHRLEISVETPKVSADAVRVEQVLVNLVENACKYTPAGGLIRVGWRRDVRHVLLTVSDNGPGIPREHHDRLFERFYRVDKGRSRELGGTGLGLAIVKHIMQRHDGYVRIESEPGHGSTFVCGFPD